MLLYKCNACVCCCQKISLAVMRLLHHLLHFTKMLLICAKTELCFNNTETIIARSPLHGRTVIMWLCEFSRLLPQIAYYQIWCLSDTTLGSLSLFLMFVVCCGGLVCHFLTLSVLKTTSARPPLRYHFSWRRVQLVQGPFYWYNIPEDVFSSCALEGSQNGQ